MTNCPLCNVTARQLRAVVTISSCTSGYNVHDVHNKKNAFLLHLQHECWQPLFSHGIFCAYSVHLRGISLRSIMPTEHDIFPFLLTTIISLANAQIAMTCSLFLFLSRSLSLSLVWLSQTWWFVYFRIEHSLTGKKHGKSERKSTLNVIHEQNPKCCFSGMELDSSKVHRFIFNRSTHTHNLKHSQH